MGFGPFGKAMMLSMLEGGSQRRSCRKTEEVVVPDDNRRAPARLANRVGLNFVHNEVVVVEKSP